MPVVIFTTRMTIMLFRAFDSERGGLSAEALQASRDFAGVGAGTNAVARRDKAARPALTSDVAFSRWREARAAGAGAGKSPDASCFSNPRD